MIFVMGDPNSVLVGNSLGGQGRLYMEIEEEINY